MNEHSLKEVIDSSTKYFNGDELAAEVFANKYALKNKNGTFKELIPKDMHIRLAKEFARMDNQFPNPISEKEIFVYLTNSSISFLKEARCSESAIKIKWFLLAIALW